MCKIGNTKSREIRYISIEFLCYNIVKTSIELLHSFIRMKNQFLNSHVHLHNIVCNSCRRYPQNILSCNIPPIVLWKNRRLFIVKFTLALFLWKGGPMHSEIDYALKVSICRIGTPKVLIESPALWFFSAFTWGAPRRFISFWDEKGAAIFQKIRIVNLCT